MCSPPNPATIDQFPKASGKCCAETNGKNRVAAPSAIKQTPISGTMETENAPLVITPQPYNKSHMPGSAYPRPARSIGSVSSTAAATGGAKLSATFRAGPLVHGNP